MAKRAHSPSTMKKRVIDLTLTSDEAPALHRTYKARVLPATFGRGQAVRRHPVVFTEARSAKVKTSCATGVSVGYPSAADATAALSIVATGVTAPLARCNGQSTSASSAPVSVPQLAAPRRVLPSSFSSRRDTPSAPSASDGRASGVTLTLALR